MSKDHLLQIIKTLTSQEKKAFTTLTNSTNKNRKPYFFELYKQYVNLLAKNLLNDKIEIELNKFLRRKPAFRRDIANIRKQLKEKILFTLIHTQQLYNKKNKVQLDVDVIQLLLKRKLFDAAQLVISQAEKLALLYDENKSLVEITDLHLYLIGQQSGKKDLALQTKLIDEQKNYITLYNVELTLKNIFRQLTLIAQIDIELKNEENKNTFKDVYFQIDLKKFPIEKYVANKNTKIVSWFYRLKSLYNRVLGNLDEAFKNSKSLIAYFENNKDRIVTFEPTYVKSICSFARVCRKTNNYIELEKSLQKVKLIYEKKDNYNALETTCDMGVLHYLNTHQYNEAIELANFVEKEWETILLKTIDGKLLWYCHSNLLLFWITDNDAKFEFWLEKGLNIPRSNKGKAFYFGVRMFELINDFEKNKWHAFLQKVETLQRTLANNENLSDFENVALSYFRKLYHIFNSSKNINTNKSEKIELSKESFRLLINTLENLNLQNPPINYNELVIWCESHLQSKTIKAIFEQQK